jgi:hypothetical protein
MLVFRNKLTCLVIGRFRPDITRWALLPGRNAQNPDPKSALDSAAEAPCTVSI